MLQIRQGVFETNSSSSHSLVIKKQGGKYTHEELMENFGWCLDVPGREGYWRPWSDDLYFGRSPFQVLAGFREKLAYAYANTAPANWDDVTAVAHEIMPEYLGVQTRGGDMWYGTDDMALYDWLNEAGVSLREFLEDSRYVVICDDDEYCVWDSLKQSGLVDNLVIDKEIV